MSTRRVAAVVLIAVALASCSDDGGGPTASTESAPFALDIPAGWVLDHAGRGEQVPEWSDDTGGANSGGFTVLAQNAEPTEVGEVTVVEATGYQGLEGGLHQASLLYSFPSAFEEREVDGRPAVLNHGGDPAFDEVIIARDGDFALALRSSVLDTDELLELEQETTVLDDIAEAKVTAPQVRPPAGWTTVGEVQADLRIALSSFGDAPGPASAHSATWRSALGGTLIAVTVPGEAGDVDALVALPRTTGRQPESVRLAEVDGRPAVVIESNGEWGPELVTTTAWGDLLVLNARYRGDDPDDAQLTGEDLLDIAGSAERMSPAEWDALPAS